MGQSINQLVNVNTNKKLNNQTKDDSKKKKKKIDKGRGTRECQNVNTNFFFLNRITKTNSCQNELNC